MSTAVSAPAAVSPQAAARSFLIARLGSLFSILPLGVWTLFHLWNNLAAFNGKNRWEEAVTAHQSVAAEALLAFFILGPLVWHTVWGISRMFKSRPAVSNHGFSNIRYMVQRLSAIGLFAFLCAHLYLAWFQPHFSYLWEGGMSHTESFRDMAAHMRHHPPTTIVYALGVLAVAYHLANGLWSFAMGWGITVSRSSQDWMQRVLVLLFVAFLIIGWAAIYGLYQAGGAFPPPMDMR
jgi:succinate dehydrogenase / fumarate reductase cytochrome b subunit